MQPAFTRLTLAFGIAISLEESCCLLDGLVVSRGCCGDPCGQRLFAKTIAAQKARSSMKWFWAGLIFGWLGLIAAAGLPDRHQIVYLRYLAESQGYQPRHACGGNTDASVNS